MSVPKPYCRLILARGSILDTLFLYDNPRRPAYATTTEGHVTMLWSINPRGKLLEIARINWVGDAESGNRSTVLVNGQTMLVDNVLQTSKSFFRSETKHFVAGTKRCKWKKTTQVLSGSSGRLCVGAWQCEELQSSHSTTSTATSGSPLAIFYPSQESLFKPELTVYPDGSTIVDHLLLTAILISAQRQEWRVAQSALSHVALEASLKTEMRGLSPSYPQPPPSSRHRSTTASSRIRRPQSAGTVRARRTPPTADPPPYTSIDDNGFNIRHRS